MAVMMMVAMRPRVHAKKIKKIRLGVNCGLAPGVALHRRPTVPGFLCESLGPFAVSYMQCAKRKTMSKERAGESHG